MAENYSNFDYYYFYYFYYFHHRFKKDQPREMLSDN